MVLRGRFLRQLLTSALIGASVMASSSGGAFAQGSAQIQGSSSVAPKGLFVVRSVEGQAAVATEQALATGPILRRRLAAIDPAYLQAMASAKDAQISAKGGAQGGKGGLVEIQGTAEGAPFTEEQLTALLRLARKGISELVELQKKALAQ